MTEKILIGVAWPYANGPLHLGHVAGAYLPADIFARYHRAKGDEVLMVSGSDQHGTPITIKAEQEGIKPAELAGRYHKTFLENWQKLGITFDLFTTTETANHARVAQGIFATLFKKGFIYKDTVSQPYCPKDQRFLPDRYLEGTCPNCGFTGARGDQCDKCGRPLNPIDLIGPHCRICGTAPVFKDTEHFFLKLTAFNERLLTWVKEQSVKAGWRPNVINFTQRYLEEGLKDRAISRDIEWGIPLPMQGYAGKRLYVWFEAVIGYLSATIEWAGGDEAKWRPYWQPDTKSYYFIGKDNIPFHTIIWPAMLMGYDETLNLPWDVPSNEFLNIEGKKLSTSRNWAVWLPDYLSRYEPDPLRYLLSANMPENSDMDFSWREFVRRNNDELVATYGNLVHRVLTFTYKNFEGKVPLPAELDPADQAVLTLAAQTLATVDESLHGCHFRDGIKAAMMLAQEANRYLDEKSPWKVIKQDRARAATSLYVTICVIAHLRTMLYPYLPFSAQKLHEYLGFEGKVEDVGWQARVPEAGQKLREPKALFIKLDDKVAEEETARLGTVQA